MSSCLAAGVAIARMGSPGIIFNSEKTKTVAMNVVQPDPTLARLLNACLPETDTTGRGEKKAIYVRFMSDHGLLEVDDQPGWILDQLLLYVGKNRFTLAKIGRLICLVNQSIHFLVGVEGLVEALLWPA